MSENKRFKRYLLDGGFWFEEYVKPIWAIQDNMDKDSPVQFLEFKDEYKDLCDELCEYLNGIYEENQKLKKQLEIVEQVK